MALGRSKVIDLYRRIGAEIHAETDIGGVPYAVISIEGKWSPFAGSCGNALLDFGARPALGAGAARGGGGRRHEGPPARAPPTVPPPTVEDTAKWIQTHVAPGYYEQGGATVPHGPLTTEEAAPACFHGGVSWAATGLDFAKRDARRRRRPRRPLPAAAGAPSGAARKFATSRNGGAADALRALVAAVAEARGVDPSKILCSSGSSSLLFSLLPRLLDKNSRVLLLRPTYGEYEHVLRHVVGCHVDFFDVHPDTLELDAAALATVAPRYDAVFLVNPNSPTGKHCPDLGAFVDKIKGSKTWAWVDETYIDYVADVLTVDGGRTWRRHAGREGRVAGAQGRTQPLCPQVAVEGGGPLGPPCGLRRRRTSTPTGASSRRGPCPCPRSWQPSGRSPTTTPTTKLLAPRYAPRARSWSADVAAALPAAKVHAGCANFFLVDLPAGISATDVVERCRELGVYLRAVGDDRIRVAVRSGPDNARIVLALLEVCGEEEARRVA